MKAAFCFYGPNGLGGPATWVRRMLPRLARRGIDVVAVPFHTEEGDCSVVADLRRAGVPVHVVAGAAASPVEGVQRMLSVLAGLRPDVIVADHVIPAFLAGRSATARGVPTVMVLRGNDQWYRHLIETFLGGANDMRVAAVVAVSRELALEAERTAPSSVEILRCPSSTVVPAETAQWRASAFHAVYVGRLDEAEKRVREVVSALISTSRALPHFSASLFGDGPLRGEIEQTLQRETGHNVSYGGRLAPPDVFPRLLAAQALVLLSASEGLSSAVQEAMACGLPVIARRTASGTDGVLIHDETALLLDDDSGMIEAVTRLTRSEALWRRLSAGARALAAREFDIEVAADRWSELLTRLAGGCTWPADSIPTDEDAEAICLRYLRDKPDLEGFEAAFLIDRGRLPRVELERFLGNPLKGSYARGCVLRRATVNGVLDAARAVPLARQLAEEAEAAADRSERHRYCTAALYQWAMDFDRAARMFSELAATTTERSIRVGSLYHLAEVARDTGRVDDAVALARTCLDLEPRHRAAGVLCRTLTPAVSL